MFSKSIFLSKDSLTEIVIHWQYENRSKFKNQLKFKSKQMKAKSKIKWTSEFISNQKTQNWIQTNVVHSKELTMCTK